MTKFSNLQVGEVLSETSFFKVVKKVGDRVELVNDEGTHVVVNQGYVEKAIDSAAQFSDEQKISRTELIAKFIASPDVALTVNFNKKVDAADVKKELLETYQNSTPKTIEASIAKTVKKALEGEERTMIGRHGAKLDEFGRVQFIDMEIDPSKHRIRQVDPRTINWLIVKGIKYTVK